MSSVDLNSLEAKISAAIESSNTTRMHTRSLSGNRSRPMTPGGAGRLGSPATPGSRSATGEERFPKSPSNSSHFTTDHNNDQYDESSSNVILRAHPGEASTESPTGELQVRNVAVPDGGSNTPLATSGPNTAPNVSNTAVTDADTLRAGQSQVLSAPATASALQQEHDVSPETATTAHPAGTNSTTDQSVTDAATVADAMTAGHVRPATPKTPITPGSAKSGDGSPVNSITDAKVRSDRPRSAGMKSPLSRAVTATPKASTPQAAAGSDQAFFPTESESSEGALVSGHPPAPTREVLSGDVLSGEEARNSAGQIADRAQESKPSAAVAGTPRAAVPPATPSRRVTVVSRGTPRADAINGARAKPGVSVQVPPHTPTAAAGRTPQVAQVATPGTAKSRTAPTPVMNRTPSVRSSSVITPSRGRLTQATPRTSIGGEPAPLPGSKKKFERVPSRIAVATAQATERSQSLLRVPGNRASSVPAPPAARYTPGKGHSRGWVDVNSKSQSQLATEADALATAAKLGLVAPQSPSSPMSSSRDLHATMSSSKLLQTIAPSTLNAALDIITPVGLSPSRVMSLTRTNTPLFGAGKTSRHPMRRSSKSAEMEANMERARAEALGLVVGKNVTLSKGEAAAVVDRLYQRAQEVREKHAVLAATQQDECSFMPAITMKARQSHVSYAVANMADTHGSPRSRAGSVNGELRSTGRISPVMSESGLSRHEYLFANAAALAAKRARAVERAAVEDEHCTFTPQITAKARALVYATDALNGETSPHGSEAKTIVSERLHSMARTIEERRALLADTIKREETPFQPMLNAKSLSMASQSRVYDPKDLTPQHLAQRKVQMELKECTFRPTINKNARSRSSSVQPVHERLISSGEEAKAKVKEQRQQLAEKKMAGATFHPTLDRRSEAMMAAKGRSVSRGSASSQITAERLYENAESIRERLQAKRAMLEAAKSTDYTFKPAIDHNSRLIALSTRRLSLPGTSSDLPTDGHPQRIVVGTARQSVWQRLHDDAKEFEEARAQAIARAVEEEIKGVTFTPAISEKSRRIADAADTVLAELARMRPADAESTLAARKAAVWDRLYALALSEPEIQSLREEMSRRLELRDCTFQPRTTNHELRSASKLSAAAAGDGETTSNTHAVHSFMTGRRSSIEEGKRTADRNVWNELAAERKDTAKLEEIKARLELAECTFAPNTAAPLTVAPSPAASRRASLSNGSPRPADAWERIVAEVEAETAAGIKHSDSGSVRSRSNPRGSLSRSASPAVFDRLYHDGVEKATEKNAAEQEVVRSTSTSRRGSEVHERLFRESITHSESMRKAQEVADAEARALSNLATELVRNPAAKESFLALEAEQGRKSHGSISPSRSSLSLSSSAALAASLHLTPKTSQHSDGFKEAGLPVPDSAPIAVRNAVIVAAGTETPQLTSDDHAEAIEAAGFL